MIFSANPVHFLSFSLKLIANYSFLLFYYSLLLMILILTKSFFYHKRIIRYIDFKLVLSRFAFSTYSATLMNIYSFFSYPYSILILTFMSSSLLSATTFTTLFFPSKCLAKLFFHLSIPFNQPTFTCFCSFFPTNHLIYY